MIQKQKKQFISYLVFTEKHTMSANTDIHRELLSNYTNVFRDHIKSYRHFQRVITKQW